MIYIMVEERGGDFRSDLAQVAQDIMAIPATSVPSERLFSKSGILSENRKSNIKGRIQLKLNKIVWTIYFKFKLIMVKL